MLPSLPASAPSAAIPSITTILSAERKRLPALLLAVLLLVSLAACTRDEAVSGSYRCVSAQAEGLEFPAEDFGPGALLRLERDGRGSISRNGQEGSLSWSRSGSALTLDIDGTLFQGSIEGDCVLLSLPSGVTLRFERGEPETEPTPVLRGGDRAWYGWWSIENSGGAMPETWYDCCARLVQTEKGLCLTIWDEDTDFASPLAQVTLRLEETDGRQRAYADYGWFMQETLGEGDWVLDLEQEDLLLSGRYVSGSENFAYRFCLRPWGASWRLGEGERVPYHTFDWYQPLIESHAEMPDKIG